MLFKGGSFRDDRGKIAFVNEFNVSLAKRFYVIEHSNTNVIRAWQGHKKETKWFFVIKGSFKIAKVEINNWDEPKESKEIKTYILNENEPEILQIDPGHVNGFKALQSDSILLIYSDITLKESELDLIRYPSNYWEI